MFIFILKKSTFYLHINCNEKNLHATSWPSKFWEINIYRNRVFRSRSLTGWFCIPASEVQHLKVIELKGRKRRCRSSTWSPLPFCCSSVQLEAQSNLSVSVTRYTEHRYNHYCTQRFERFFSQCKENKTEKRYKYVIHNYVGRDSEYISCGFFIDLSWIYWHLYLCFVVLELFSGRRDWTISSGELTGYSIPCYHFFHGTLDSAVQHSSADYIELFSSPLIL